MEKNRRSIVGMGDLKASIVVNDHNPNPLGTLNDMGADDSDNDSIKSRK